MDGGRDKMEVGRLRRSAGSTVRRAVPGLCGDRAGHT